MKTNRYHNLLPVHLQDKLKRSVSKTMDDERFTNIKYMNSIDETIEEVRREYPQAFKGASDAIRVKVW